MIAGRDVEIQIAGDVCLDVVGIPVPPPAAGSPRRNNWQLTGETRTHYLLGGALLLADFVRSALPLAVVRATRPCKPAALTSGRRPGPPLSTESFLRLAPRLTRDEIVHSLLRLDYYRATPDAKKLEVLRVERTHGFSGPTSREPSLPLLRPQDGRRPAIIVLDDTGNRFRRTRGQWPTWLSKQGRRADTLVVYKLHRPLPGRGGQTSPLWQQVQRQFSEQRLVILSIDDLRDREAPISRGLSWERTALDLVWQLLNGEDFAPLRDLPHLIVRMGLDGTLYWQRRPKSAPASDPPYRAWLIYDPAGIEGTGESACEGRMVGYGSAFTAALVKSLAESTAGQRRSLAGRHRGIPPSVELGIRAGLAASRRLLKGGFELFSARGPVKGKPQPDDDVWPKYPGKSLFVPADDDEYFFACQEVPIIPAAAEPDRSYWRLLDSIFDGRAASLHRAVALTATGRKPVDPEDKTAADLLRQVPTAVFAKALRTCDRREIENYRALYALFLDYIRQPAPPRPLSVAVFGAPGAGKSFGVKMVAKALGELGGPRPIESLTFNLSQYQAPDQLAEAFHLVRDLALRGKIPLVFFDEFDTSLGGMPLGWLRYFLAPMQDAAFLDRGVPHPIGQAIFVFAGGTCSTYSRFAGPLDPAAKPEVRDHFQAVKGPDFLSRLRGTLDIPGLDLHSPCNAYGQPEAFPCEAAILLRRAGILAHQLREKAPELCDSSQTLQISPAVLRALLHLPQFEHGNRSFEALLDMSRLPNASKFTPSLLPASGHVSLHAKALHLRQLLATDYPFPAADRERIAQSIHRQYLADRKGSAKGGGKDRSLLPWNQLPEHLKESNRQQADHIAVKLRSVGLWFRKLPAGRLAAAAPPPHFLKHVETLAQCEHDRWVVERRRRGWIAAPGTLRSDRREDLLWHESVRPWTELSAAVQDLDRSAIRHISSYLAAAGYEIVEA